MLAVNIAVAFLMRESLQGNVNLGPKVSVKQRGVELVRSADQAARVAGNLIGKSLVTIQTGPAGQTVRQTNALVAPVQISFAQVPATLAYAGLAPGAIGLYQFNSVVPNIVDSDAVPLTVTQPGAKAPEQLSLCPSSKPA